MLVFIKNIVLVIFFGIVPMCLTAFLVFTGFQIYSESIQNGPESLTVAPRPVLSTEPKNDKMGEVKPNNPKNQQPKTNTTDPNTLNRQANQTTGDNTTPKALDKKVELPSSVMLKIPLIYQAYNLNCEATSLAMALQYRGVNVTQQELMPKIGYAEPFKKTWKDGKMIWGDPDKGFVGSEKGYLFTNSAGIAGGTGWGVNNGPVAKVAQTYFPGSVEIDNATIEDLKQALAQDKPVIFWHQRDDARKEILKYVTPEGKEVKQFQNHVNVLVGYKTDPKSGQTTYYFNDPIYGKMQLKEADLIRIWAKYNNEIVVVN